jgi:hypothetical protein
LSLSGVSEGSVIVLPSLATTNLTVTASLSPAIATNVVFVLEHQGAVLRSTTSPPPFTVTFNTLSAGKYFLSAYLETATNVVGDVSFDIASASLQPANDHWSNAAVIPGLLLAVTATNLHATRETGEPVHAANAAGHSVWWRWQAISNGIVTVTTKGSDCDTVLAAYSGTNFGSLNLLAANDDAGLGAEAFSQVSLTADAGASYYFAVDGAPSQKGIPSSGMVQLRVLAASPPSVAINSPLDGLTLIVPSPATRTNVVAMMAISDPTGITAAQYWFDGADASRSGGLLPPYQLSLTNLTVGDCWLTIQAANPQGLISVAYVGLSVVSRSAEILLVDTPALYTNGFHLAVSGLKGPAYTLEASTNLDVWCTIGAWTNFPGIVKFTDTNATRIDRQFYRAFPQ